MNIIHFLINIFFPTQCILCNKEGSDICQKCLSSLQPPKISEAEWIISMGDYRDPCMEKLMRYIKNIPNKRLVSLLVEKFYQQLLLIKNNSSLENIHHAIIIPIPIHRKRFQERGYNQAELIAYILGKKLKRTVAKNILYKNRHTQKQGTAATKVDRLKIITGSFSVKNPFQIKNQDIILVDDITTTGATLREAKKTLLTHGARNVIAITLAN